MSGKKRKAARGGAGTAEVVPNMRIKRDANTIADFIGRYAFLSNGAICQFGVRGMAAGGHM